MELYTLNRDFQKQETIDEFDSVIWTERYYGNGEFELVVPGKSSMISKLAKDQFIMCEDSDIPMIIENREIKDGVLTAKGIDLVKWLNNRIFRTSADHSVREFIFPNDKPGEILAWIVQHFCISGPFLDGTNPIGISTGDLDLFPLPGLVIGATDTSGSDILLPIPFGPIYDILEPVATTYEIGMKIELDYATASDYQISFHSYKGADRTSAQGTNPVIQFSKAMDSFTNITDLESISDYKNLVFTFAVNAPATYMTGEPGRASSVPGSTSGFDLRIYQEFADFDTAGHDVTAIGNILDDKAIPVLSALKAVQLVDGEIVQNGQINYGEDYFLGDLVEVVGNTGILQTARITEYIRSQDNAGERSYPTLTMIDE